MRTLVIALTVLCSSFYFLGCAHKMPATTGMTKQEVIARSGAPAAKWNAASGVECWKYQISTSVEGRGGTWFIIMQNDQVLAVSEQGRDSFSILAIGLPEFAVIEMIGKPEWVSATKDVKYLNYHFFRPLYVRIINGVVESYGNVGDFDSTKIPEKTLNVNIDEKRSK